MEATTREILVLAEEGRLDLFLAREQADLTRTAIKRLVAEGHVTVNDLPPKVSQRLRPGDRLRLTIPPPVPLGLEPENIAVGVVYQDDHLIVVDKPAGLSVHPGPGHPAHTLVNALLALCPDLPGIGGYLRPGIVHRLDKDTSGLMVVAKTEAAHRALSRQFKDRATKKGYLALVKGIVKPDTGTIDAPLGRHRVHRKRMAVVPGGRNAITGYKVLEQFKEFTLLEALPETGRTHQIRVHLAYLGHPLMGDATYGSRHPALGRHFLHAYRLEFLHPGENQRVEYTSALPSELQQVLDGLR